MKIGKFLKKHFDNQKIELLIDRDIEWIQYAESSMLNGMIVQGIFVDYDEECGVLTMSALHNESVFYVSEECVHMFWQPGLKITESIKTTVNTGQKLFKGNKT